MSEPELPPYDNLFARMNEQPRVEEASTFNINGGVGVDGGHIVAQQHNEVVIPASYMSDGFVAHRESDLRKARELLNGVSDKNLSIKSEVYLGLSTTFLGWFLGGITSGVGIATVYGALMYCVAPSAAVGFFVAFFFTRREAIQDTKELADHVLEYLADPDDKNEGIYEY